MQVHTRQVTILTVGRLGRAWQEPASDYARRLGRMVRLDEVELRQEPLSGGVDAAVRADSARVLERLARLARGGSSPSVLVADPRGRSLGSEELASWVAGQPHVAAVVGGAAGLSDEVRSRAGLVLAIGRVTLPHELARVVVLEQLYRSLKILRGEPYHC